MDPIIIRIWYEIHIINEHHHTTTKDYNSQQKKKKEKIITKQSIFVIKGNTYKSSNIKLKKNN